VTVRQRPREAPAAATFFLAHPAPTMAMAATARMTNLLEYFTFEFPPMFPFYRFAGLDAILS
jgi:hypothetical protein